MAWFKKEKKPRLPRHEKLEIPPDAWEKCDQCGHTDLREKFVRNLNVCMQCGHHRRIRAVEYANLLLDEGTAEETEIELRSTDPLGFPDYPARLKKANMNAGEGDAILTFTGQLGGMPVCLAVMDFAFMGGSMGSVVGEKLARLGQVAIERKYPLIIISASGGARMQEGILSLMQMPRTILAADMVKEAGLPYIVILTDPTTGGVAASFASIGDITLAEPGAIIGFAGARVIEETIREKLPEGFQRAEYLHAHGMVDQVVPRGELHEAVARILSLLREPVRGEAALPAPPLSKAAE